jgi:hypothetical protein
MRFRFFAPAISTTALSSRLLAQENAPITANIREHSRVRA